MLIIRSQTWLISRTKCSRGLRHEYVAAQILGLQFRVAYHESLLLGSSRLFGKRSQNVNQRISCAQCSTSQWCRNL